MPQRLRMPPIDRSIPPVRITSVIPTASRSGTALVRSRFVIFADDEKFGSVINSKRTTSSRRAPTASAGADDPPNWRRQSGLAALRRGSTDPLVASVLPVRCWSWFMTHLSIADQVPAM
ncbi:hypothetical protein JCM18899A_38140 [Nocardioides sp. AN3]